MIAGGRVLGLVAARGGSRGIPRKNLRVVGGLPLLHWTARAAAGSRYLDDRILSTDDDEIARVGRDAGLRVPFMRPAELASDTASAAEVILHALDAAGAGFDYLVYLQPTSPLRTAADIDGCLELLVASGQDCCVSVEEARQRPEWMFHLEPDGRLQPLLGRFDDARRQALAPTWILNGAVYAARVTAFRAAPSFLGPRTVGYQMPAERSVDIDEEIDLALAEVLMARARPGPG